MASISRHSRLRVVMHLVRHLLPVVLLIPLCFVFTATAATAAVTVTSPVTLLRNQEYGETLLRGIRDARESVLFSFYLFKTSDTRGNMPRKIADELIAARRRGVEVTVYLEKNRRKKDLLDNDNRRTAALLHRGGVTVRFDSPTITTHTKAVVIDRRFVYLGSHNLTQGALLRNNELSVLVDSPELAATVKSYLDRL